MTDEELAAIRERDASIRFESGVYTATEAVRAFFDRKILLAEVERLRGENAELIEHLREAMRTPAERRLAIAVIQEAIDRLP